MACCSNTHSSCSSHDEDKSTTENPSSSGSPCHRKLDATIFTPDAKQPAVGSCDEAHRHGHARSNPGSCAEKCHNHGRLFTSLIPKNISISKVPKTTKCSTGVCCVRRLSGHTHGSASEPTSTQSESIKYPEDTMSTIIQIDSDSGASSENEQITLSLQGMTCTGCEANLRKVLCSFENVSNIKTSLLLAQAEFDLRPSATLNGGNVAHIVQQMTGFTCTRTFDHGEELDLILPAGISSLEGPWPQGLVSLACIGKQRVRICYDPRFVGARTLLSHPFFRGAQFAPDPPSPKSAGSTEAYRTLRLTVLSAFLTIPVLVLSYTDRPDRKIAYGIACLCLATIVQTVVAQGFYIKAYKTLRYSRMIEMDMLVVLSTTTAYVYSVIAFGFLAAGKSLSTDQFFETSTLLVTLILVGQTVAAYARQRAIEIISIESLQVQAALVVTESGEETIDARLLQYGDKFKVLPDTGIVTDGIILEGETEVDESLVTGEANLIWKKHGMSVIAGSINHSGTLLVELTQLPSENTIKKITTMVDEAKSTKAKVQDISDRVAGNFTLVILGITAVVFLIWVIVGKHVKNQSSTNACINAMTYAISTLIVSCPCAIGLAVPMVLIVAGGVGAKYGLVFKSAETIEIARKVTHVVFDKTGTLTQGNLEVVEAVYLDPSENFPSVIMGLTSGSNHPVSRGIVKYLQAQAVAAIHVDHIVSVPSKGIEGISNGTQLRGGNLDWLGADALPAVHDLLQRNLTIFCVKMDDKIAAVFGLQDQIRPDAHSTIEELKRRSITVSLLSGDNEKAVNALGIALGIPESNIRSCCTPASKQTYIASLISSKTKNKPNTVLFCGDGTNDAVALARASIGMHINGGTDVAQSAADAILMNSSLKRIVTLIDLSKAFYRRVVFNFVWCFMYNTFAILLAAGAFPNVRIPPAYAGLGELVSVLPVIAVAMQLRWKTF